MVIKINIECYSVDLKSCLFNWFPLVFTLLNYLSQENHTGRQWFLLHESDFEFGKSTTSDLIIISIFLGRFGSNEEDLKRYEERIATLKEQLSQEKERNEELKAKLGDGSRAGQDELRASQTEKARLQREVRNARGTW